MLQLAGDKTLKFPNQLSYEMNMTQINETSYGKVIIRAVTASEAERVTSHTH